MQLFTKLLVLLRNLPVVSAICSKCRPTTHLMLADFISFLILYLVNSTNYEVSRDIDVIQISSVSEIFPAPCSQTTAICVLVVKCEVRFHAYKVNR